MVWIGLRFPNQVFCPRCGEIAELDLHNGTLNNLVCRKCGYTTRVKVRLPSGKSSNVGWLTWE